MLPGSCRRVSAASRPLLARRGTHRQVAKVGDGAGIEPQRDGPFAFRAALDVIDDQRRLWAVVVPRRVESESTGRQRTIEGNGLLRAWT